MVDLTVRGSTPRSARRRVSRMVNSVVHFEIIGVDADALRSFYGELFGWSYDVSSPVAPEVSDVGNYGFITPEPGAPAVAGGVGGGPGRDAHAIFYVGVDDVSVALATAERLGATRVMGPATNPNGVLVVGQFVDPAGNLVGVAGPR
jgi:predicted enzyme related to lactoylglutathione lyase